MNNYIKEEEDHTTAPLPLMTRLVAVPPDLHARNVLAENRAEGPGNSDEREIRKMKSAGDLRRGKNSIIVNVGDKMPRPAHPPSISSANLSDMGGGGGGVTPDQTYNKRSATLGPNAQLIPPSRPPVNAARPQLSQCMSRTPPIKSSIFRPRYASETD